QVASGLDVRVLLMQGGASYEYPYRAPPARPGTSTRWQGAPLGAALPPVMERGAVTVGTVDEADTRRALALATHWKPDAVHLHSSWLWPVACATRARTGARIVYTVHSLDSSETAAGEAVAHGTV